MTRISGEKEDLDIKKVELFFAKRSQKIQELGLLPVTMYQDEALAHKRDAYEKAIVEPYLNLLPQYHVLDIGCGTGRWASYLNEKVAVYLGLDFCEAYLTASKNLLATVSSNKTRFHFQQLSATEITLDTLHVKPPFDIIIIAGLMVFLNDHAITNLLEQVIQLSRQGTIIYCREPMGIQHRLTLKDDFSEELQEDYHAIYRTSSEYEQFFQKVLCPHGFLIKHFQPLYPEALCNRKETQQCFFILERK